MVNNQMTLAMENPGSIPPTGFPQRVSSASGDQPRLSTGFLISPGRGAARLRPLVCQDGHEAREQLQEGGGRHLPS